MLNADHPHDNAENSDAGNVVANESGYSRRSRRGERQTNVDEGDHEGGSAAIGIVGAAEVTGEMGFFPKGEHHIEVDHCEPRDVGCSAVDGESESKGPERDAQVLRVPQGGVQPLRLQVFLLVGSDHLNEPHNGYG